MISSASAVFRFALQRLMSSSFQNYDLSSFLLGHYRDMMGSFLIKPTGRQRVEEGKSVGARNTIIRTSNVVMPGEFDKLANGLLVEFDAAIGVKILLVHNLFSIWQRVRLDRLEHWGILGLKEF